VIEAGARAVPAQHGGGPDEQREAEQALRFHETLLRETGEIARVGGWHFDVRTSAGFWTEEVARIHEVDPNDPIGRDRGIDFYHGQDRGRIASAVQCAIERAEPYDSSCRSIRRSATGAGYAPAAGR